MNQIEAAKELIRRRKAKASLAEFARYIEIPGTPISEDEDEDVFTPIEEKMVKHHILTCDVLQGLIEGTIIHKGKVVKGAMIFEPPGSAKTTYGNVVASAWAIGRTPGYNIITTSYQTPLALKQSRKMIFIFFCYFINHIAHHSHFLKKQPGQRLGPIDTNKLLSSCSTCSSQAMNSGFLGT